MADRVCSELSFRIPFRSVDINRRWAMRASRNSSTAACPHLLQRCHQSCREPASHRQWQARHPQVLAVEVQDVKEKTSNDGVHMRLGCSCLLCAARDCRRRRIRYPTIDAAASRHAPTGRAGDEVRSHQGKSPRGTPGMKSLDDGGQHTECLFSPDGDLRHSGCQRRRDRKAGFLDHIIDA
jgi:hypothetical protein